MSNHLRPFLLAAVLLAACKRNGGGKPELKPIGDSGFVVDAPSSWKVEMDMKDFYTVTSDHHRDGWVQVVVSDRAGAASLDDLVKSADCDDPTKAVKETTASGALFVQCTGVVPSISPPTFVGTKIRSEVTIGGRHASCHIETNDNVETDAAVCKSLRKK